MRWLSIISIMAMLSSPAYGAPKTFAVEVADAKASLIEGADEAFVEFWARKGRDAPPGILSEHIRQLTRWGFIGFSLGMCERYTTPTDKADWLTKFDRYAGAMSVGSGDTLTFMREQGEQFLADGRRNDVHNEMSAARAARFCKVELTAVRSLMSGF